MGDFQQMMVSLSGEDQEHILNQTPSRVSQAGEANEFCNCLTNFEFIDAKTRFIGMQAVIDDFDYCKGLDLSNEQLHSLKDLQNTLRQISGVLTFDHRKGADEYAELATQLWLRLNPQESPLFERLLNQSRAAKQEALQPIWLRPRQPFLQSSQPDLHRSLSGHIGPVYAVAITPDGSRIVSGGSNGEIMIWDIGSGQRLASLLTRTLDLYTDIFLTDVVSIAVSPDGKALITLSLEGAICIWNLENYTLHKVLRATDRENERQRQAATDTGLFTNHGAEKLKPHRAYDLAYYKGGGIVVAFEDCRVRGWNVFSGEYLGFVFPPFEKAVSCVAMSEDGRWVVAGAGHELKILDLIRGTAYTKDFQKYGRITALFFVPANNLLIATGGNVVLLSPHRQRTMVFPSSREGTINTVIITPDTRYVCTGHQNGIIVIRDLGSEGNVCCRFSGHVGGVFSLTISPDGQYLISAGDDAVIKIWRLEALLRHDSLSPSTEYQPSLYENAVSDIVALPDGKHICTAGERTKIKMWSIATMKLVHIFEDTRARGAYNRVGCLAVSPDGNYLFSAGDGLSLVCWNLFTGEWISKVEVGVNGIGSITITSSGKQLITGSDELPEGGWGYEEKVSSPNPDKELATIRAWSISHLLNPQSATGRNHFNIGLDRPISTHIPGYHDSIQSIAVSTNEQWLVAGGWGTGASCWYLPTMEKKYFLPDLKEPYAITNDSQYLIGVARTGELSVIALASGEHQFDMTSGADPSRMIISDATTSDIKVSPCGRFIAASSTKKYVLMWNWDTHELITTLTVESRVNCCTFSKDGMQLIIGDDLGKVYFLQIENAG